MEDYLLQNQRVLFIVLTIVLVIILGYLYWKIPQTKRFLPLRIIAVFVMAGAAGNFIDRFLNGYVVDFVYFKLINFPIFNVADCYITVSAAALLVLAFFYYKEDDDWTGLPARSFAW